MQTEMLPLGPGIHMRQIARVPDDEPLDKYLHDLLLLLPLTFLR